MKINNCPVVDVEGCPEVLVKRGTTCPVMNQVTRSYPVTSVVGIPIQLLYGKGPFDPDLTVGQVQVLAREQIVDPGSTIYFKYSIDENKQTVTIMVEMFGRETPVEIGFYQVKKID